ncbi:MAG: hypothetical protein A2V65_10425 [Deltaproteobacteria bacterium RBG_13_49_15]|nr:MAG: hypothetical protein A2V65_10425 [Deltaproteobacteria bacterium RBG_13_49_15]
MKWNMANEKFSKLVKLILILCLSLFFIFFAATGVVQAKSILQVIPTTASVVDETVVVGKAGADEGASRNTVNLPTDLDQFIPMPLPQPRATAERSFSAEDGNRPVFYQVATGKETVLGLRSTVKNSFDTHRISSAGREPSGNGRDFGDPPELEYLTDLIRIENNQDYPWRAFVKVFLTFPYGKYVCSGTLIKPNHVITAGHCVHEGSGGSWADGIIVVPGYKDGWQPYGAANAVSYISWQGWTVDGSFDHDIGVIRLDRNIGAVVGWHSYGYTNDWSWYGSTLFRLAGYPAEYPYSGRYLYYQYGYYDYWWTDHQLGYYNLSYGGQSGSGSYYYDGSARYVYAVLSNGNFYLTNHPIITENKFYDIHYWMESGSAGFDLTPLGVTAKPLETSDDRQMEMAYIAHNASSASWSGTVMASVYVSKNENISASDTLIQKHSFKADFGPWSSVEVKVPLVSIPESAAKGIYYLGVILDIDDGDVRNNDSDGQDAAKVFRGRS